MFSGSTRRACVSPRAFQRIARQQRLLSLSKGYATATPTSTDLSRPGAQVHGFTLKQVKKVPELELTALQFQHDKTGGEYLHLAKEDPNNVFSIGFKTNPPDRTGVPHILEHNTLCGSVKYPVRDPFFKMMPRSLNNFMNAMTYPDHTIYPFATTNKQDFNNLLSVYLDATFHPLLRSHDFAQEGWRIGPQDSSAETSEKNPLVFKGVVYNEMKGNMSSADYLFRTRWQDHVFPAINDSGGDPEKMTDLTHEQLKKFQAEHYNASNTRILTYGDMPVEGHLERLNTEMSRHERVSVDQDLKVPIALRDGPQTVTVKGPIDMLYPRDQQYKASVTWTMGDSSDVRENFSVAMISSLLLDGFSAPVYQNTIEIGWGASYSPNTGYDSSAKTGMFTVGLNGLKKHDVGRLRSGLVNTLAHVKRIGFDKAKIEGRLQQIEIGLKHKTAEFGMGIATRLQDSWFNGTDPMKAVAPEEILSAFRKRIEDPAYLMDLFQRYFLNDNTFTFIMEPSENFAELVESEEASRLQSKIDEFSAAFSSREEANRALEKQEAELVSVQESGGKEDLSSLPSVHVSDIPRQGERKDVRHSNLTTSAGSASVQWRETPTNGLTYFRAIQPLKDLPDDLRIYLPLFSIAIQRLGTRTLSLEALEDSLRFFTGGISLSHHSVTSPQDINHASEGIAVSATALDRNVPQMFDLLRIAVTETDFTRRDTQDKLAELIKGSASTAINDVADSGHAYARRFAEAGIAPQARLDEELDGMTQVRLIMDFASRSSSAGYSDVAEKLAEIQHFALTSSNDMRVAMTCGADSTTANETALQNFIEGLPKSDQPPPEATEQMPYPVNAKTFFPLPYQVYYSALSTNTVPYVHPDSASLAVLAQLLTHKYMHPEVREKGGAYGGSAYAAALKGTFGFASYRDPDAQRSLGIMRGAGAWASSRSWTDRELEEAKLSVFQSVDAPQSVSDEGMAQFLSGVTPEMRQERRERLLDVTVPQVRDVAEKYLHDIAVDEGKDEKRSNEVVLGAEQEWLSQEKGWNKMPLGSGEQVNTEEDESDGYVTL
ncbi:MAG: hypothetical protein Q9159_004547 [Coniocarpon cinnabarinum]